jgi:hypothetical protein
MIEVRGHSHAISCGLGAGRTRPVRPNARFAFARSATRTSSSIPVLLVRTDKHTTTPVSTHTQDCDCAPGLILAWSPFQPPMPHMKLQHLAAGVTAPVLETSADTWQVKVGCKHPCRDGACHASSYMSLKQDVGARCVQCITSAWQELLRALVAIHHSAGWWREFKTSPPLETATQCAHILETESHRARSGRSAACDVSE